MSASESRSARASGSTPSFLSSTAPRSVVRWMMRAFASMSCGAHRVSRRVVEPAEAFHLSEHVSGRAIDVRVD